MLKVIQDYDSEINAKFLQSLAPSSASGCHSQFKTFNAAKKYIEFNISSKLFLMLLTFRTVKKNHHHQCDQWDTFPFTPPFCVADALCQLFQWHIPGHLVYDRIWPMAFLSPWLTLVIGLNWLHTLNVKFSFEDLNIYPH